jgi:hypothetical protein
MGIALVPLLLWLGLAALSVALVVLLVTRWGVSRPLFKCLILSLLAHVLLAAYAATVQIVFYVPRLTEETYHFSSIDVLASGDGLGEGEGYGAIDMPLEQPLLEGITRTAPLSDDPKPVEKDNLEAFNRREIFSALAQLTDRLSAADLESSSPPLPPPIAMDDIDDLPEVNSLPDMEVSASIPAPKPPPAVAQPARSEKNESLPVIYSLRNASDRTTVAQRHGATSETEAAVKAALRWLAENQSKQGQWDSRATGGGNELFVLARNRQNAGIDADTGMTGLALLAMLASGHTHLGGDYQENVRRGLEFLLRIQGSDGNLGGPATAFSRMYCHGIATFALSEAYGMTGDSRLREPVRRAIAYTVAAQNPTTGGWRYVPGDPGDTSQFGWQWMALKSAELAGIPIPEKTRQAAIKYLQSVASGRAGGLASYRPSEPATRTMTAEALVCWQFLGMPREHPAGDEAGDFLLSELPAARGQTNLYYWYYATLGMYQLQGKYWQAWNQAVQKTLVENQRKSGPLAGSWDTDDVWGGYGGRVFTTALATLILEVYYRFLPLYAEVAGLTTPRSQLQ